MLDKKDLVRIVKQLAGLVLDYLRWTQFIPMILLRAFACAMIAGLVLIGAQEAMLTDPDRFEEVVERAEAVLLPFIDAVAPVVSFLVARGDGLSAQQWVLGIWGWLALIGMLASWLRATIAGPRAPWPFRRKLWIAAVAAVVYGLFIRITLLVLDVEASTLAVVLNVAFFPLVLIIASGWGLAVSHIIDRAQRKLQNVSEEDVMAM